MVFFLKKEDKILRVAESKTYDVGTGILRVDGQIMQHMGLVPGDYVQITGRKRTAAVLGASFPEDENRGIVRMDGIQRRNAGASLDDKVAISKVAPKNAVKITVAPVEELKLTGAEEYVSTVLDGRVVSKGDIVQLNVMGSRVELMVTGYVPSGSAAIISRNAKVTVSAKAAKDSPATLTGMSYDDIGGLSDEVKKVREMIELPLKHPELFERLGVEAPKGVLLHGPPGTGKTLLAKAVASETNANFLSITGPEIMSKFYGESEERLREIFKQAEDNAPSIIFIDEIDSIAPKRDEVTGETERRVVAQLLALMDGLESRGKVVVIGATNRPNAIDGALRRPGRFDREIEINIPDRTGRYEILNIHTRGMPLNSDVDLERLADLTHGYAGADVSALTKEAAMRALRRVMPDLDLELDAIPAEILNTMTVTQNDFFGALRDMQPSSMREVLIEKPNVHWDDIGGLKGAKQELKEVVEWPIKYADLFYQVKARTPRGVLMYGPPGTGKTMLAKAVATESQANFINVKGPEFLSKWVGESEKAVREIFRKARQAAPCIIFMDEIDSIVPKRGSEADAKVTERIISQMLTEMDGLETLHNVVVIAATNRPDLIDEAILRPGRFDRVAFIPLPDIDARRDIIRIHTRDMPLDKDVNLDELASKTDGFTGADVAGLCNEAALLRIRRFVGKGGRISDPDARNLKIAMSDFQEAMEKVRPTSRVELEKYVKIAREFEYVG